MWFACLLTSLFTVSWAEPPTHRAVLAAVAGYSYDPPPLGWSAMPRLHTDRVLMAIPRADLGHLSLTAPTPPQPEATESGLPTTGKPIVSDSCAAKRSASSRRSEVR